jgi:hypothetical protein
MRPSQQFEGLSPTLVPSRAQGEEITTGQVKQFDLPISAFKANVDNGRNYVPIYRCTYDRAPTSSSTSSGPYQFRRIMWMGQKDTLDTDVVLKIQVHIQDLGPRFEVVGEGHVLGQETIVVERV